MSWEIIQPKPNHFYFCIGHRPTRLVHCPEVRCECGLVAVITRSQHLSGQNHTTNFIKCPACGYKAQVLCD